MRKSVGQIRLRNLAVLSLVHKTAAGMNIKEIISDFANAKAQKKSILVFNVGHQCRIL